MGANAVAEGAMPAAQSMHVPLLLTTTNTTTTTLARSPICWTILNIGA